jgi:hypothetical protein
MTATEFIRSPFGLVYRYPKKAAAETIAIKPSERTISFLPDARLVVVGNLSSMPLGNWSDIVGSISVRSPMIFSEDVP